MFFGRTFAADSCTTLTRERQAALSPDDALTELRAGNERFLTQNMRNCDLLGQVRATAGGQYPFALVIGCIDSRVPPELVFDQRIGDIFSARMPAMSLRTMLSAVPSLPPSWPGQS
jgi:carbonic anhydrase